MGLIASALREAVGPLLKTLPQFAYMDNRSCHDAIFRVDAHSRNVQHKLLAMRFPLHLREAGHPLPELEGGIMVSLDLTRAFDCINRQQLFEGMSALGVPPSLFGILQSIYRDSSCSFFYRGTFRQFRTYRGIRQGCRAAPYMCALFTAHLLIQ